MSLRPGSSSARELFHKIVTPDILDSWHFYAKEQKYESIIQLLDEKKKAKGKLIELDNFWRHEYSSQSHFELRDVSRIMQWKLLRGKARPLQKLVDSNKPDTVKQISSEALTFMERGDWQKGMNELIKLKGIGDATASAILAPLYPDLCPFMADEVIESATDLKRDYTRKVYIEMRKSLLQKSKELNDAERGGMSENQTIIWTPELVGRSLWTKAMIAAHDFEDETKEKNDEKPSKKRRGKGSSIHDNITEISDTDTHVNIEIEHVNNKSRKRRLVEQ